MANIIKNSSAYDELMAKHGRQGNQLREVKKERDAPQSLQNLANIACIFGGSVLGGVTHGVKAEVAGVPTDVILGLTELGAAFGAQNIPGLYIAAGTLGYALGRMSDEKTVEVKAGLKKKATKEKPAAEDQSAVA